MTPSRSRNRARRFGTSISLYEQQNSEHNSTDHCYGQAQEHVSLNKDNREQREQYEPGNISHPGFQGCTPPIRGRALNRGRALTPVTGRASSSGRKSSQAIGSGEYYIKVQCTGVKSWKMDVIE